MIAMIAVLEALSLAPGLARAVKPVVAVTHIKTLGEAIIRHDEAVAA